MGKESSLCVFISDNCTSTRVSQQSSLMEPAQEPQTSWVLPLSCVARECVHSQQWPKGSELFWAGSWLCYNHSCWGHWHSVMLWKMRQGMCCTAVTSLLQVSSTWGKQTGVWFCGFLVLFWRRPQKHLILFLFTSAHMFTYGVFGATWKL